ncbi:MAG: hypothetical protein M1839_005511 [Geoglossum umbratile]|nr:MAG: hypothetical protein M1839_005511 [Geoglossum umbratile]
MATKVLKNRMERLRKRKKTLFKRAHELGTLCSVDVAVIIRKDGRYFTYRSINQGSWPPSMKEIQTTYPLIQDILPQDMQVQDESPIFGASYGQIEDDGKEKSDINEEQL